MTSPFASGTTYRNSGQGTSLQPSRKYGTARLRANVGCLWRGHPQIGRRRVCCYALHVVGKNQLGDPRARRGKPEEYNER